MDDKIIDPITVSDTATQQDLTQRLVDVLHCHDCGQPLRVYTQPSPVADHPDYDQAECVNGACLLWKVTLEPQRLASLTEAQRESYREPRRRQIEHQNALAALDEARCLLASREYVRKHPLKSWKESA